MNPMLVENFIFEVEQTLAGFNDVVYSDHNINSSNIYGVDSMTWKIIPMPTINHFISIYSIVTCIVIIGIIAICIAIIYRIVIYSARTYRTTLYIAYVNA